MQWIPDTIDALARLYHETGLGGFVALAVGVALFLLVVGIVFVLTRHTGQLVGLGQAWVAKQNTANVTLESIDRTNKEIAESNIEIKERVGKLPSDPPPGCLIQEIFKDKTREQAVRELKDLFARQGFNLTDQEIEIVMAHRKEVQDVASKATQQDMPKFDSSKVKG